MTDAVLICRPGTGARATARRALALGLEPVLYPLFEIAPLAWDPPDPALFDAVMLTSANAVRQGGPALARYRHLPAYVVGEATAGAAQAFGFADIILAGPDVQATAVRIAADGHRSVFHPGGVDKRPFDPGQLMIRDEAAYHMAAAGDARGLADALAQAPLVLVHSPRAGERLAALVPPPHRAAADVVAISPAAGQACGSGWRGVHAAPTPDDSAMLAMARQICQNRPMSRSERGPGAGDEH